MVGKHSFFLSPDKYENCLGVTSLKILRITAVNNMIVMYSEFNNKWQLLQLLSTVCSF